MLVPFSARSAMPVMQEQVDQRCCAPCTSCCSVRRLPLRELLLEPVPKRFQGPEQTLLGGIELSTRETFPQRTQLLFKGCSADVRSGIEAFGEDRFPKTSSDLVADAADVLERITHDRSLSIVVQEVLCTLRLQTLPEVLQGVEWRREVCGTARLVSKLA